MLALGWYLNAQTPSQKNHVEENGFLKVEAEDFYKQTKTDIRKWYIISKSFKSTLKNNNPELHTETASGKKYIEILPDTRVNHKDKLISGTNFSNQSGKIAIVHYKVKINTPGRYYIWAKAYSTGSEDNGVHVGLNGTWPNSGQKMQWCEGKNAWTWTSKQRTLEVHCGVPGLIYLDINKAGEHDIQFSMREDGFEMDEWLMTTDKHFNPETLNPPKNKLSLIDKIKKKHPNAIAIKAENFKSINNTFFIDRTWLAINPDKNQEAEAFTKFTGNSGIYDIVVHGVGENHGRTRFTLKVNNNIKGTFRPELSTEPLEEGPDYSKAFTNITLKSNDVITIKGKLGSRDRIKYTHGLWSGISIVPQGEGQKLLESLKSGNENTPVIIKGELKKWHKVSLTFNGPLTSETNPYNPFMNYRFNVKFSHPASGKTYIIPGYFAANGYAGQSSATSGNKWRVHIAPDEIGTWTYAVDFRKGNWVAVSNKEKSGVSAGYMDGATGTFTIENTDKKGRDFRSKGRLQYVGKRYLKFAETGEYFLKQGPDSPENFLSYTDFDGTFHNDGHKDNLIKTWEAHEKDWKKGDLTWKNGKGKAIVGALNYLASKGLNSVSFLTNNIVGDDQNVFPYIDYNTYNRIDVSKMDQWEALFKHAQKLGLFLHFKTLEVENQGLLDNGGVGANTKLYYRELIARFGHHLALNWNLGEENGEWIKNHATPPQTSEQRLAMTHYFKNHDPYHHHLVIHNGVQYDDLLGKNSGLTGPSIQTHKTDFNQVHGEVLHWLKASKKANLQWAVAVDEPGDAQHALLPDNENPNHDMARRNALWGTFMAGGWGNEWYFGYKHPNSDITCQDYRSRDLFWNQAVHAIKFFKNNNIPFWDMENRNDLVGNPENKNTVYCLAKQNDNYVVYLNGISTSILDLSNASGDFEILWYNPKKGGELQKSKIQKIKGGRIVNLGNSPDKTQQDWAILIRKFKK
ncbi:hypothetical protein A8C32_00560 [Flavivirga aquatica]|uniref:DUF5060 domain-containing protein n=1 Tax=Flavivirga aquatica TaxID=1849968 RepID=A0A1E5TC35_9FLAO|nr:hypothetical protein A8C32_00560 [Flavivirga aquatica]